MKLAAVLLILTISIISQARLVIISDIDDTIKVSHILGKKRGFSNAFRTQNLFLGMPELYQALLKNNPNANFYYISKAPWTLMQRSHKQFLEEHNFPEGTLLLRRSLKDTKFKLKAIREALKKDDTIAKVIFFGDNAESDPSIYATIAADFSHITFHTFIRHAYSKEDGASSTQPNQVAFVTPVEIGLELKNLNLLTADQAEQIKKFFVEKTSKSAKEKASAGPVAFPEWMNCSDFKIPSVLKEQKSEDSKTIANLIRHRCSI